MLLDCIVIAVCMSIVPLLTTCIVIGLDILSERRRDNE